GVGGVGLPLFLSAESIRLVFFCGKGGVGKTTCATSAALRFAIQNPTKSVLILSTDPAHSLKMVLDEGGYPENLSVLELDAASALHAFKDDNESLLKEIADRGTFLDKEDIENLMSLSMPGMDEVAAYLALSDLVNQDVYDRIFIDTAPTGHTLRFVQMPELAKRWLDALDALLAKHRFMRRRFAKNDVL
ncbi:ArsA family ATPase, partial [Methyloparacoccus murrellii]